MLGVRAAKIEIIKNQLLSVMGLGADVVTISSTKYNGIRMISVSGTEMSKMDSIRNIEAILLDELAASELQHPSTASDALSFKSLDGVDEREQYEHLSQLLHIQKATRDKR